MLSDAFATFKENKKQIMKHFRIKIRCKLRQNQIAGPTWHR